MRWQWQFSEQRVKKIVKMAGQWKETSFLSSPSSCKWQVPVDIAIEEPEEELDFTLEDDPITKQTRHEVLGASSNSQASSMVDSGFGGAEMVVEADEGAGAVGDRGLISLEAIQKDLYAMQRETLALKDLLAGKDVDEGSSVNELDDSWDEEEVFVSGARSKSGLIIAGIPTTTSSVIYHEEIMEEVVTHPGFSAVLLQDKIPTSEEDLSLNTDSFDAPITEIPCDDPTRQGREYRKGSHSSYKNMVEALGDSESEDELPEEIHEQHGITEDSPAAKTTNLRTPEVSVIQFQAEATTQDDENTVSKTEYKFSAMKMKVDLSKTPAGFVQETLSSTEDSFEEETEDDENNERGELEGTVVKPYLETNLDSIVFYRSYQRAVDELPVKKPKLEAANASATEPQGESKVKDVPPNESGLGHQSETKTEEPNLMKIKDKAHEKPVEASSTGTETDVINKHEISLSVKEPQSECAGDESTETDVSVRQSFDSESNEMSDLQDYFPTEPLKETVMELSDKMKAEKEIIAPNDAKTTPATTSQQESATEKDSLPHPTITPELTLSSSLSSLEDASKQPKKKKPLRRLHSGKRPSCPPPPPPKSPGSLSSESSFEIVVSTPSSSPSSPALQSSASSVSPPPTFSPSSSSQPQPPTNLSVLDSSLDSSALGDRPESSTDFVISDEGEKTKAGSDVADTGDKALNRLSRIYDELSKIKVPLVPPPPPRQLASTQAAESSAIQPDVLHVLEREPITDIPNGSASHPSEDSFAASENSSVSKEDQSPVTEEPPPPGLPATTMEASHIMESISHIPVVTTAVPPGANTSGLEPSSSFQEVSASHALTSSHSDTISSETCNECPPLSMNLGGTERLLIPPAPPRSKEVLAAPSPQPDSPTQHEEAATKSTEPLPGQIPEVSDHSQILSNLEQMDIPEIPPPPPRQPPPTPTASEHVSTVSKEEQRKQEELSVSSQLNLVTEKLLVEAEGRAAESSITPSLTPPQLLHEAASMLHEKSTSFIESSDSDDSSGKVKDSPSPESAQALENIRKAYFMQTARTQPSSASLTQVTPDNLLDSLETMDVPEVPPPPPRAPPPTHLKESSTQTPYYPTVLFPQLPPTKLSRTSHEYQQETSSESSSDEESTTVSEMLPHHVQLSSTRMSDTSVPSEVASIHCSESSLSQTLDDLEMMEVPPPPPRQSPPEYLEEDFSASSPKSSGSFTSDAVAEESLTPAIPSLPQSREHTETENAAEAVSPLHEATAEELIDLTCTDQVMVHSTSQPEISPTCLLDKLKDEEIPAIPPPIPQQPPPPLSPMPDSSQTNSPEKAKSDADSSTQVTTLTEPELSSAPPPSSQPPRQETETFLLLAQEPSPTKPQSEITSEEVSQTEEVTDSTTKTEVSQNVLEATTPPPEVSPSSPHTPPSSPKVSASPPDASPSPEVSTLPEVSPSSPEVSSSPPEVFPSSEVSSSPEVSPSPSEVSPSPSEVSSSPSEVSPSPTNVFSSPTKVFSSPSPEEPPSPSEAPPSPAEVPPPDAPPSPGEIPPSPPKFPPPDTPPSPAEVSPSPPEVPPRNIPPSPADVPPSPPTVPPPDTPPSPAEVPPSPPKVPPPDTPPSPAEVPPSPPKVPPRTTPPLPTKVLPLHPVITRPAPKVPTSPRKLLPSPPAFPSTVPDVSPSPPKASPSSSISPPGLPTPLKPSRQAPDPPVRVSSLKFRKWIGTEMKMKAVSEYEIKTKPVSEYEMKMKPVSEYEMKTKPEAEHDMKMKTATEQEAKMKPTNEQEIKLKPEKEVERMEEMKTEVPSDENKKEEVNEAETIRKDEEKQDDRKQDEKETKESGLDLVHQPPPVSDGEEERFFTAPSSSGSSSSSPYPSPPLIKKGFAVLHSERTDTIESSVQESNAPSTSTKEGSPDNTTQLGKGKTGEADTAQDVPYQKVLKPKDTDAHNTTYTVCTPADPGRRQESEDSDLLPSPKRRRISCESDGDDERSSDSGEKESEPQSPVALTIPERSEGEDVETVDSHGRPSGNYQSAPLPTFQLRLPRGSLPPEDSISITQEVTQAEGDSKFEILVTVSLKGSQSHPDYQSLSRSLQEIQVSAEVSEQGPSRLAAPISPRHRDERKGDRKGGRKKRDEEEGKKKKGDDDRKKGGGEEKKERGDGEEKKRGDGEQRKRGDGEEKKKGGDGDRKKKGNGEEKRKGKTKDNKVNEVREEDQAGESAEKANEEKKKLKQKAKESRKAKNKGTKETKNENGGKTECKEKGKQKEDKQKEKTAKKDKQKKKQEEDTQGSDEQRTEGAQQDKEGKRGMMEFYVSSLHHTDTDSDSSTSSTTTSTTSSSDAEDDDEDGRSYQVTAPSEAGLATIEEDAEEEDSAGEESSGHWVFSADNTDTESVIHVPAALETAAPAPFNSISNSSNGSSNRSLVIDEGDTSGSDETLVVEEEAGFGKAGAGAAGRGEAGVGRGAGQEVAGNSHGESPTTPTTHYDSSASDDEGAGGGSSLRPSHRRRRMRQGPGVAGGTAAACRTAMLSPATAWEQHLDDVFDQASLESCESVSGGSEVASPAPDATSLDDAEVVFNTSATSQPFADATTPGKRRDVREHSGVERVESVVYPPHTTASDKAVNPAVPGAGNTALTLFPPQPQLPVREVCADTDDGRAQREGLSGPQSIDLFGLPVRWTPPSDSDQTSYILPKGATPSHLQNETPARCREEVKEPEGEALPHVSSSTLPGSTSRGQDAAPADGKVRMGRVWEEGTQETVNAAVSAGETCGEAHHHHHYNLLHEATHASTAQHFPQAFSQAAQVHADGVAAHHVPRDTMTEGHPPPTQPSYPAAGDVATYTSHEAVLPHAAQGGADLASGDSDTDTDNTDGDYDEEDHFSAELSLRISSVQPPQSGTSVKSFRSSDILHLIGVEAGGAGPGAALDDASPPASQEGSSPEVPHSLRASGARSATRSIETLSEDSGLGDRDVRLTPSSPLPAISEATPRPSHPSPPNVPVTSRPRRQDLRQARVARARSCGDLRRYSDSDSDDESGGGMYGWPPRPHAHLQGQNMGNSASSYQVYSSHAQQTYGAHSHHPPFHPHRPQLPGSDGSDEEMRIRILSQRGTPPMHSRPRRHRSFHEASWQDSGRKHGEGPAPSAPRPSRRRPQPISVDLAEQFLTQEGLKSPLNKQTVEKSLSGGESGGWSGQHGKVEKSLSGGWREQEGPVEKILSGGESGVWKGHEGLQSSVSKPTVEKSLSGNDGGRWWGEYAGTVGVAGDAGSTTSANQNAGNEMGAGGGLAASVGSQSEPRFTASPHTSEHTVHRRHSASPAPATTPATALPAPAPAPATPRPALSHQYSSSGRQSVHGSWAGQRGPTISPAHASPDALQNGHTPPSEPAGGAEGATADSKTRADSNMAEGQVRVHTRTYGAHGEVEVFLAKADTNTTHQPHVLTPTGGADPRPGARGVTFSPSVKEVNWRESYYEAEPENDGSGSDVKKVLVVTSESPVPQRVDLSPPPPPTTSPPASPLPPTHIASTSANDRENESVVRKRDPENKPHVSKSDPESESFFSSAKTNGRIQDHQASTSDGEINGEKSPSVLTPIWQRFKLPKLPSPKSPRPKLPPKPQSLSSRSSDTEGSKASSPGGESGSSAPSSPDTRPKRPPASPRFFSWGSKREKKVPVLPPRPSVSPPAPPPHQERGGQVGEEVGGQVGVKGESEPTVSVSPATAPREDSGDSDSVTVPPKHSDNTVSNPSFKPVISRTLTPVSSHTFTQVTPHSPRSTDSDLSEDTARSPPGSVTSGDDSSDTAQRHSPRPAVCKPPLPPHLQRPSPQVFHKARLQSARRQYFSQERQVSAPERPSPPRDAPQVKAPSAPNSPEASRVATVSRYKSGFDASRSLKERFEQFSSSTRAERERLARSTPDLSVIEASVRRQRPRIDSWSQQQQQQQRQGEETGSAAWTSDGEAPGPHRGAPTTRAAVHERYKSRAQRIYARSRSQSAGVLETDLDTGASRELLSPRETDIDDLYRDLQQLLDTLPSVTAPTQSTDKTRAKSLLDLDASGATMATQLATPARPPDTRAKSMEFLLDNDNKAAAQPPENELMKGTERQLSEAELRVRRSLQRLDVPEWMKNAPPPQQGFLLRRRDYGSGATGGGGWSAYSSKTASMTSLGSSRAHTPNTPTKVVIPTRVATRGVSGMGGVVSPASNSSISPSPSDRSGSLFHYPASRWSTSRLNSGTTTPTGSVTSSRTTATCSRQPYLGWRSQTSLASLAGSQSSLTSSGSYLTAADRLALGITAYSQRFVKQPQPPAQDKENCPAEANSATQPEAKEAGEDGDTNGIQLQVPTDVADVHSSIKEVTSAIVHYCNESTPSPRASPRGSPRPEGRAPSPRRLVWVESSFVGSRPITSPETPTSSSHAITPTSQLNGHDLNEGSEVNPRPPQPPGEYLLAW